MSSANEVSHYVVTAHPPGAVLRTAQCNFMAPDSLVRSYIFGLLDGLLALFLVYCMLVLVVVVVV